VAAPQYERDPASLGRVGAPSHGGNELWRLPATRGLEQRGDERAGESRALKRGHEGIACACGFVSRESLTSDVGEVGIAPLQVGRQHGHRLLVAQPAKREEGVGAAPLEPAPAQLVCDGTMPVQREEGGPYCV
jgi:hypothetical protein